MRRFKIALLLFFCWLTLANAIAQKTLSGKIKDKNDQPLPFVTVNLLQNGHLVLSALTSTNGQYALNYTYNQASTYTISASSIGYDCLQYRIQGIREDSTVNFQLLESSNQLKDVRVNSKNALITRKADRFIVNVEDSKLSSGYSALEVLGKSPGVWVSSEGTISIKGNQQAVVMINNTVQHMTGTELVNFLSTLKSEEIAKIEVISNPPSEYEASGTGGIVHIILKKPKANGFNGAIYGSYRQQGTKPYTSGGASFDIKTQKVYFYGSYSQTFDKKAIIATNDISYPTGAFYNAFTRRNDYNRTHNYRIGSLYQLAKSQTLGIETVGNTVDLKQRFVTNTNYNLNSILTTGLSTSERIKHSGINSTTLNYNWLMDSAGSSISFIGDYTYSHQSEVNHYVSMFNDETQNQHFRNSTPTSTKILSLQTDYTKLYNNTTTLKFGAKYSATDRNNLILKDDYVNAGWQKNPAGSNHFLYDEKLAMAYTSAERTFGPYDIKGGLRGEGTVSKGNSISSDQNFSKKYFSLFPSVYILRNLDEATRQSIYFSYSHRIRRPSYADLNPYTLQFDNYVLLKGNPNLLPQYAHNIELGYHLSSVIDASLFFNKTNNLIAQLASPQPNSSVIVYQPQNFNSGTEFGLNISTPIKLFKWWQMMNSATLYHSSHTITQFTLDQTTFKIQSSNTITIKNIMDIDVFSEYNSPYLDANSKNAAIFYTDIGLSKQLFNKDLNLGVYIADMFNSFREKSTTDYQQTIIYFYQKRPTRTLRISFLYNIHSGSKFNKKKLEQGASEERSRIGG